MNSFWVLLRKEWTGYFLSPLAYAVTSLFLVLMGVSFNLMAAALASGRSGIHAEHLLIGTPLFWVAQLIVIPLLTMRLFAEEKRLGTIETLLTAPVTDFHIIMAKYAGSLFFYIMMWIPTLFFYFMLQHYNAGQLYVDYGALASAYIGVVLSSALFIAMGMMCSLFATSQIIAAMISFSLLTLLCFSGYAGELLPGAQAWVEFISPVVHMREFSRGIIDTRRLVYYAVGIAFFIFTSTRILESRQWR